MSTNLRSTTNFVETILPDGDLPDLLQVDLHASKLNNRTTRVDELLIEEGQ